MDNRMKSGERVFPEDVHTMEEHIVYLKHVFIYEFLASQIKSSDKVLEVGFGQGYGVSYMSNYSNEVHGVEVNNDLVMYAKNKHRISNCFFNYYDGTTLPFKENSFDVIVSSHVIEHIEKDKEHIEEIYRVLKNNGTLFLITPNRKTRVKPNKKPWFRFHVREYTENDLISLTKLYFQDVNIKGIDAKEDVRKLELNRIKKAQFIDSLDPFNLRKFIPNSITPVLIKFIKKVLFFSSRQSNLDFRSKYKPTDYYIVTDKIDFALDIVAVANKKTTQPI